MLVKNAEETQQPFHTRRRIKVLSIFVLHMAEMYNWKKLEDSVVEILQQQIYLQEASNTSAKCIKCLINYIGYDW